MHPGRKDIESLRTTHSWALPAPGQEIWAYGLRNPWRFSFDSETGRLWVGDVGQNDWEEVDLVEKGQNYGWNNYGRGPLLSAQDRLRRDRLAIARGRVQNRRRPASIIGGYVSRSGVIRSLTGAYVYGDFCSGKIWGLRHDGQSVTEHALLVDSDQNITSFGLDLAGELYILSRDSGIYRLVPMQ